MNVVHSQQYPPRHGLHTVAGLLLLPIAGSFLNSSQQHRYSVIENILPDQTLTCHISQTNQRCRISRTSQPGRLHNVHVCCCLYSWNLNKSPPSVTAEHPLPILSTPSCTAVKPITAHCGRWGWNHIKQRCNTPFSQQWHRANSIASTIHTDSGTTTLLTARQLGSLTLLEHSLNTTGLI